MSQKHRNRRLKKALALELLEDRTLLSGNVTVVQVLGTGQLLITGDNGNNAYSLNETTNLGMPTLTVAGSSAANPIVPGNVTAIDYIPGGVQNFPLASVSSIAISEGNGTNTILFGNTAGFSIPGNISIGVGTGVDTVSLNDISANAGIISFTGAGASLDKVSETSVVAGESMITTGSRGATITQSMVAFGMDIIKAGNGGNTISITNSLITPPPRSYAIGMLMLTAGNGNNSVTLDGISVGPTTVTLGTGNNSFTFDDSTIQQASITIGSETSGAQGSNKVDISRDTVTGSFLNLSVLNESGISGKLANGANALGLGSVNTLTMNNVQFTAGGNLRVTIDDGTNYYNSGNNGLFAASTVLMELIDTGGNISVTLGDWFESVMLGVGTIGLNDLDSNNLTVSIGNQNDIIVITAIVTETETVTIGNVTTNPVPPVPAPSVLINGSVGDGDDNDGLFITLGNNGNGGVVGWPVMVSDTVNGNMTITGGGGIALTVTTPPLNPPFVTSTTTVTGVLTITEGDGGAANFQSITLNGVTASQIFITITTSAGEVPDTSPLGAYITLTNVNVTSTSPGNNLTFADNGVGVDIVTLMNVNVVYGLLFQLAGYAGATDMAGNTAPGSNVLSAENVTAAFGMIDGGGAAGEVGAVYQDLGGNFGYFVLNFVGH
jgi:hypothetical protein